MLRSVLPVVLAGIVLASPPAAADTPTECIEAEVQRIQGIVEAANRRVERALGDGDWARWYHAHDAYVMAITRAVPQVERAIARYMLAVLEGGGSLDRITLRVIDGASTYVGSLAKHRAIVSAYGTLARHGVRPDGRAKALQLLARQGVYRITCPRQPGSRAPAAEPAATADSPMCGRVPGSTEATEHLRKWQYAHLKVQTAEQQVASLEAQLDQMPVGAGPREGVEQRLAQKRAELAALRKAAADWRQKYYDAGGQ